jgi:hypothetical protein
MSRLTNDDLVDEWKLGDGELRRSGPDWGWCAIKSRRHDGDREARETYQRWLASDDRKQFLAEMAGAHRPVNRLVARLLELAAHQPEPADSVVLFEQSVIHQRMGQRYGTYLAAVPAHYLAGSFWPNGAVRMLAADVAEILRDFSALLGRYKAVSFAEAMRLSPPPTDGGPGSLPAFPAFHPETSRLP